MKEYLNIFIDKEYPHFIDKYLATKTLKRLKHITQFCGCDYTKLYSPLFLYTRYDHSLVVAHMTWHFTHDRKETIAALLHDVGTPCFAHTIDYVLEDYINQESSEKSIVDMIKKDKTLLAFLKEDDLSLEDLKDDKNYHILENKSPKLCADRLDGVLHTCYVWLHTHSLKQIKEIYDNLALLENEENIPEIGFKNRSVAEMFTEMVYTYAKELQGNKDKYIMKYICEIVKLSVQKKQITLEDLYTKKEEEIIIIWENNFPSWKKFNKAANITSTDKTPKNIFYISLETKKRNTIPLVHTKNGNKRIIEISKSARAKYEDLERYKDKKYAYIKEIEKLP